MDREHQRNKPDKGQWKDRIQWKRTQTWRNSTQERAYSEEYTNTVQLVNKRHLHSTTTIQLYLTTADYQRICQDHVSEFFLNNARGYYRRGFQFFEQLRFKTLQLFVPNSKRLRGYTQWVHFFLKKSAYHSEDFFKTRVFKQHKIQDPPTFCSK